MEAGLLGVNILILTLQISHCNNMTQRYIDIGNLTFLSVLELVVGGIFI
jgi:hypothetical protein